MTDAEFYLFDLKTKFNKINPNDYYLAYSGGKDSHFLYWFIREYTKIPGIQIISCNTYLEHKEIRERMYANADEVLLPSMTPREIKAKYGIPCFTKQQDEYISRYQRGSRAPSTMLHVNGFKGDKFALKKKARILLLGGVLHPITNKCCYYLKKKPFKDYEKRTGKKAIMGVRACESNTRKANYTSCFTKNGNFTPIYDLSDELLEQIYTDYNIEIPNVYNFVDRTGCMGCPYGGKHIKTELDMLKDKQREFIIDLFRESYIVKGIIGGGDNEINGKTEEVL